MRQVRFQHLAAFPHDDPVALACLNRLNECDEGRWTPDAMSARIRDEENDLWFVWVDGEVQAIAITGFIERGNLPPVMQISGLAARPDSHPRKDGAKLSLFSWRKEMLVFFEAYARQYKCASVRATGRGEWERLANRIGAKTTGYIVEKDLTQ